MLLWTANAPIGSGQHADVPLYAKGFAEALQHVLTTDTDVR